MTMIPRRPPSVHPTPPRCPWCRGTLTADGDCLPCRAVHEQQSRIRARERRRELLARLAALLDVRPAELIDLLREIARGGAA